jgi:uncharacterized protein YdcH (DUF465 family)
MQGCAVEIKEIQESARKERVETLKAHGAEMRRLSEQHARKLAEQISQAERSRNRIEQDDVDELKRIARGNRQGRSERKTIGKDTSQSFKDNEVFHYANEPTMLKSSFDMPSWI